jgi:hypothetical protein
MTYDVLFAVVSQPAAHGRGTVAKVTAADFHAVAWRMSFGTETVGFLKLAIFGLRAIEYPARAVALTTEIIVLQASWPSLRTALPFLDVRKRLRRDARGSRELCRWVFPSLRAGSAPARVPSPSTPLVRSALVSESSNRSETSPW